MGHRRIHIDVPPAGRAPKHTDDSTLEDSPVLFFRLPKRLLNPFTFGDVIKRSDKASLSGSMGGDGEPHPQGFNFDFETFWLTGQYHSSVSLKQFWVAPRDDLGKSFSHHVCQAGQLSKCTVDIEIDKIDGTATVVKKHLAVCEPLQHVFKQRAITPFAFCHRILRSPALSDVLLDGDETSMGRIAGPLGHGRDRHLFDVGCTIFPPVDDLAL